MGAYVHLFPGHDNDDGTVTVTSVISLCCKTALPTGSGTVDPSAVTCPAFSLEGGETK